MQSGVYCFRNIVNNKIYVGSSVNVFRRKQEHLKALRTKKHFNTHMQYAFNKYGEANLEFTMLEEVVAHTQLVPREQYWIDYYDSAKRNKGYNISSTVNGGCVSLESRKKHSITNRRLGIKPPSQLGTIQSEATKLKRSISMKKNGHKPPSNKGKKLSAETIQKISMALKGNKNGIKKPKINIPIDNP